MGELSLYREVEFGKNSRQKKQFNPTGVSNLSSNLHLLSCPSTQLFQVEHSIVGERTCLDSGVELKDTLMMGADFYQTEAEIASHLAVGKVPIGIGQNTKIRYMEIANNCKFCD
ncbi:glucose-1-phosphate adenylyltransferase large subunit 1-like [Silene latifolia]|uniref:glucose-1-phosphate adenylyltransferase large subunit 1-like n=1 Tax=Silene latifolia TaxID=37657 RepID=UPI003D773E33